MNSSIEEWISRITGASDVARVDVLQSLWSGYGEIVRYALAGATLNSVVVKHINVPTEQAHPRGWNTDTSHQRKLQSYGVEAEWYRRYAEQCNDACAVARCYGVQGDGVNSAIVLQDLDAAGYPERLQYVDEVALQTSVRWLANFHACWLNEPAEALWPRGSYWHLATRPDEFNLMPDGVLKTQASALDAALEQAQYKTLIHGDAKIANFCYSSDHRALAAVDFQYVGVGVGVVDLAYFLGSCLDGKELEQQGEKLLELYLRHVGEALVLNKKLDAQAIGHLQTEWRNLYPIAWADFERFLQGWSPGHPKLNNYSARQTEFAIHRLKNA